MNVLRNSFLARCLASFLLTTFVSQICFPTLALALTSGPSQPEVQTFQTANTTDMVNLFSGDFNYNIPLFELPGPNGGYPFNIAYNSGASMDQEASWVGLGWNLNPGALTREMRGLPDDFNGDQIVRESDMRTNYTWGVGGNAHKTFGVEIAGFDPAVGLGLGMTIFYNSYNGVGYSLDQSANFSMTNKNDMNMGIGLSQSLNSQEGIGLNPTVNIGTKSDNIDKGISIGLGYNSNAGMTGLTLQVYKSKTNSVKLRDQLMLTGFTNIAQKVYPVFSRITNRTAKSKWTKNTTYLGTTYSFGTPSYVPRSKNSIQGRNASLSYLQGIDPAELDLYIGTTGFFNTQYIKDRTVSKASYGYLYMQNDGTRSSLIDYNRSQDGQILKNTPYLPAPILTQDIYSANAQGISAMYRPQRSDLGIMYDDHMQSQNAGGSLGGEFAIMSLAEVTFLHFGMDLTVNYSVTNSGAWTNENYFLKDNGGVGGFSPTNPYIANDRVYEPAYFKVYGEMTSDSVSKFDAIGGYEPYRVSLDDHHARNVFENDHGSSQEINGDKLAAFFDTDATRKNGTKRKIRQASVIPFKNGDINNIAGTFNSNTTTDNYGNTITGGLAEFTIDYFTSLSTDNYKSGANPFTRNSLKNDHIGGFVTTNPDGMKYVYALPAYNAKQVECQFSVALSSGQQYLRTIDIPKDGNNIQYKTAATNQTNQYYNKVTTPAYAHSYLLTSVLGADYIDADNIIGPSAGDLGYWVKFSYVKAVNTYNWRTPFAGANYIRGSNTSAADDIAMYMYGEKEVWHLAKAETQTHVAVFSISTRNDAKSAANEVQNASETKVVAGTSFKLDKVSLYTREQYNIAGNAGKPLVTAIFTYTYDLCGKVPNNDIVADNQGKLTLKSLYFTYGDNTRGALSPYKFDYHERLTVSPYAINSVENPDYQEQAYDRWGVYKPYSLTDISVPSIAQNNPYTQQFDQSQAAAAFRAQMDNQASVWTLKCITLPSGGKIDVAYEADDYAYVQNKAATQMMPITGVGNKDSYSFTHGDLKVYFPLETSIPSGANISAEIKKYIPDNNQLYFKVYSTFSSSDNGSMYDYVSGYADVETDPALMGVVGTAPYTTGYVTLKKSSFGKSDQFHPFALAAWLHVRTEAPYLLNIAGMKADPNTSDGQKTEKISSLLSIIPETKRMFGGFYNFCDLKGFGKTIDGSRSFIRLQSPDKCKIGGGVRVKQIVLSDNWSQMTSTAEKTNYYGQVYNYTMEENGAIISSGVASNEPQVGGDESPLRYTESYIQKVPARTPNRLLVEHPINDAYYPAEGVGYRKVTVKSLASNYTGIANNPYEIAGGILRSGAACYEFYTAKDFPVIEKFTNTVDHPFNLPMPIPFLGRLDINKLTMSQGFYIELNDMHGKLKVLTNYSLDKSGNVNPQPLDYTKYNYQATPVYSKTGTQSNSTASNNGSGEIDSYILNNKVNVLLSDDGTVKTDLRYMGQDVEFFTDMRETETQSFSGGGNFNIDLAIVSIPPGVFPFYQIQPSSNWDYARCRTTVSNKIVHKSGILVSVENYNQGAKKVATHSLFDPYTGQPLLTTVTNDFEDPIYQYDLPAHLVNDYRRIGGKFSTQGIKIDMGLIAAGGSNYTYTITSDQAPNTGLFQKGDKVFVLKNTLGILTRYPGVITAISSDASNLYGTVTLLNNVTVPSGSVYTVEIYDPVFDNNYGETAYSVTSLQDPTANRIDKNCSPTYTYPNVSPPCVNNEIRTPDDCFRNLITGVNQYITTPEYVSRASFYTNQSLCNYDTYAKGAGVFGGGTAPFTGSTSFYPYIKYASTGGGFNLLKAPSGTTTNIDVFFYYATGTAVNFDQVAFLQTPVYTGATAPSIPGLTINANTSNFYPTWDVAPTGELPNFYYSTWKTTVNRKDGTFADAYILYHRFGSTTTFQASVKGSYTSPPYQAPDRHMYFPYTTTPCTGDGPQILTGTLNLAYKSMSKIIDVSATTFGEFKPLDDNSVANKDITSLTTSQSFDQLVAYLNGSAGTFRAKESWTYLDDRSQTTAVNLRTDGTFDDVPFFKHNSPLCKGCPARWKRIVKFTDYFPSGTPQEEEDALGNKSAVLFGYSGAQVTAVAANTSVYEIGFESFEDYPNISSSNTTGSLQNYYIGKNNLNFYTPTMNRTMDAFANYCILSANKNILVINKPYTTNLTVTSVDVDGQQINSGAMVSGRYTVQQVNAYPGDATKTMLTLSTTALDNTGPWMGNGKFKLKQSSRALNTASIVPSPAPSLQAGIAHTGKYSLIAPGGNIFEQRRLILTPGKKMVFEGWVKALSPSPTAGVRFYDNTGAIITASNLDFGLTTIVVEGWTKIYGEFTVPTTAESLGIYLYGGTGQYGPGISYFDDIRVYPWESNMVSYVYDRSNFRLLSILDNNNFATYYYYDPSGSLYLTKKETERGILTIQEAQTQIKAQ